MVGVQSLVSLGTLLYASVAAVLTIRSGGSEAAVGSALLYTLLSLAVSVGLLVVVRGSEQHVGAGRRRGGAAEGRRGAVRRPLVGFGLAVVLTRLDADTVVPHIDPVRVLSATAMLILTPLRMMRTSIRELLEAAPDHSVTNPVTDAVTAVRQQSGLPEPDLRIGQLGRKLYIELDFVVDPGVWDLGDADLVRLDLLDRLTQPGRLLWVNVELHTDPAWDH